MYSNVRVSILIKALNEEGNIARCLDSAIKEASLLNCEIILIDSLSTDRTVEIARSFPIRIVQFKDTFDCCCGAAAQLGYQYAAGEYLYLLDGDMELQPGFISEAIAYLDAHTSVAGVGGLLNDTRIMTPADKRRAEHYSSLSEAVFVDHLGGGGLFRRNAIASVGYLANRWLLACEEIDLGMRLLTAGWCLVRLPILAVKHTGYNESSLGMLCRLWKNGRMRACGVFLRSALGRPWWWASVKYAWYVLTAPIVYFLAILSSLLLTHVGVNVYSALLMLILLFWCPVFFFMLWKKKSSVSEVLLAIVAWHLYTIAAIPGFLCKAKDPYQPISACELK